MSAPHPPVPEPEHTHPLTTSTTEATVTTTQPDPTQHLGATGATGATGADGPATWWEAGRHPVNVGHLVMGVAFLGLTLVWALLVSGAVEAVDARWLLPLPWLAAGGAGMAATVLAARRRR